MEENAQPIHKKYFVQVNGRRTVCEVLREVYWYTADPFIRERIKTAMYMAKRMNKKLIEYKADWDANEWEATENVEEKIKERKEKFELEA